MMRMWLFDAEPEVVFLRLVSLGCIGAEFLVLIYMLMF